MRLNLGADGTVESVCVDMGEPELDGLKIPVGSTGEAGDPNIR